MLPGRLSGAAALQSLGDESQLPACEKRWAGKAQAGIKIAGRNINNLRYADDTILMAESEEELKNLLMKVKEESWLKAQHSEN